jgi:glutamine amidotransferase
MCRFIAYLGAPVLMDDLLFKPKNSLIRQSIHSNETEEPLNGDGFGIGWYMRHISPSPALFVSVRPAWNERNLQYLASKIVSSGIFAHVRAASHGDVSEYNCHPFHFRNLLFMHNGDINGFFKIKRLMEQALSEEAYSMLQGQTDSEHLFAIFYDCLPKKGLDDYAAEDMATALESAVMKVQELKRKVGLENEEDYLNIAITDGNSMIAMRYTTDKSEEPPSLYFSEGRAYNCIDGVCHMQPGQEEKSVLVVSERLTTIEEDWKKIPRNHILLVEKNLTVQLRPCRI